VGVRLFFASHAPKETAASTTANRVIEITILVMVVPGSARPESLRIGGFFP
jgi:hypothetical protein